MKKQPEGVRVHLLDAPTPEQTERIVDAVFYVLLGQGPRVCESVVVRTMWNEQGGEEALVKQTAEYVWDHMLGEPRSPKPETLVKRFLKQRLTENAQKYVETGEEANAA